MLDSVLVTVLGWKNALLSFPGNLRFTRNLLEQYPMYDPGKDSACNRSEPEQPELLNGPTAREDGNSGTASRID